MRIWVVEWKGNKRWWAWGDRAIGDTRKRARFMAKRLKRQYPQAKFRVVSYTRDAPRRTTR